MHLGDRLPGHARESIQRLAGKYFEHMSSASVRFGREGNDYRCTVIMQMGDLPMRSGEATSKDIYVAYDAALAPSNSVARSGHCVMINPFVPTGTWCSRQASSGCHPCGSNRGPSASEITTSGRATMLRYPMHGFAKRVEDTVARAMAILRAKGMDGASDIWRAMAR